MDEHITYLSDGLYVKYDGYQIYLMANNPYNPTDTVALDDYVLQSFLQYVNNLKKEKDNG